MLTTATHEPLTDEEFERLGSFLEKTGTPGVNCEWVDGYFAALICGPEPVLPSECLDELLGEDVIFDSRFARRSRANVRSVGTTPCTQIPWR